MTRVRAGALATVMTIALAARPDAASPPEIATTVTLGTPATLEIQASYSDPVELFKVLDGTLVFPLWLEVRNVTASAQMLDVATLQLRLGDVTGTPVTLASMNARDGQKRLAADVKLNPALKTILGQSGGPFSGTTYDRDLRTGELKPGKSRSGYVFFLKPAGFQFNGFMSLGTRRQLPELLPTQLVPTITRGDGPAFIDSACAVIVRVPGGQAVCDAMKGTPPFGKSYALLFGIATYSDAKYGPLPGVATDVARMSDYLGTQGFEQVAIVRDREVTPSTLRDVQAHFATRITPADRLLVYYAGHGQRADRGPASLVLSPGTRVPMTDFMAWLRAINVKHLLVLMDACYAGSVINPVRTGGPLINMDSRMLDKLQRLAHRGSRFVITAGDAMEEAHEDQRLWQGGLFTDAVLRALRPDGQTPDLITTHDIFARAKSFMFDEERKHNLTLQTPLIMDLGYSPDGRNPPPVSEGEFVFVSGK